MTPQLRGIFIIKPIYMMYATKLILSRQKAAWAERAHVAAHFLHGVLIGHYRETDNIGVLSGLDILS